MLHLTGDLHTINFSMCLGVEAGKRHMWGEKQPLVARENYEETLTTINFKMIYIYIRAQQRAATLDTVLWLAKVVVGTPDAPELDTKNSGSCAKGIVLGLMPRFSQFQPLLRPLFFLTR